MDLPFILRKENIAYIKNNFIYIGDRRVYPFEKNFIKCVDCSEVYSALKNMVTQGGGPLIVALEYMRLCCYRGYSLEKMKKDAMIIASARPTNTTMADTLSKFLGLAEKSDNPIALLDEIENHFDEQYDKMSDLGSSLIEDGDTILTTCFAEQSFFLSVLKAIDQGKKIKVAVNETRPYLQGARLTAPSLKEARIPCFLITDGMGANLMADGKINRYMTASDMAVSGGYVINKTGTLSNAICAKNYDIEYYAFSLTPRFDLSIKDVKMEVKDGNLISLCNGNYITQEGIEGYYPAFDIIPPEFVSGIITPERIIKNE